MGEVTQARLSWLRTLSNTKITSLGNVASLLCIDVIAGDLVVWFSSVYVHDNRNDDCGVVNTSNLLGPLNDHGHEQMRA